MIHALDPVSIRMSLECSRAQGATFEQAWSDATPYLSSTIDEPHVVKFMRWHFSEAYYDTSTGAGRCFVPERDTSNAVLVPREHHTPTNFERCRSGDGCDRAAVCGRWGLMWCEYHGEELARLTVKVTASRDAANPRNGGNASLFTHKANA